MTATLARVRAAALALLLAPLAAFAQVTLNLKDADIQTLVATVSEITGKNFVIDPRVSGTVSLISARPLSEDEIYEVFLSILATHGFVAVPGDKVIRIVPAAGAKQEPIPTVDAAPEGGQDQPVTKVIQVRNTAVEQLVAILRPLLPPQAHLAAYADANVLVVSDSYANVQRIDDIVRRIDGARSDAVEVVSLVNAAAENVVQTLRNLDPALADAAGGARLVADARSNSVLLSGSREQRERLRRLVERLDTPLAASAASTEVVYLRYASAPELLDVLRGVSDRLPEQNAADPAAVAATAAVAAAAGLDNAIDIQADEATNALIISAAPDQLATLKGVIARLDIRRAQVLVEAVIAEVSSDKVAELGVQWLVDGSGGDSVIGFTNFDSPSFGALSLGDAVAAALSEQTPSGLPSGAALALGDFSGSVRFGALISALASDADTNVLATPNLVTLDNEEAEIIVGQNVPFVTGSFTTEAANGGVDNPFQTIERRDVGLTLRVRPQINEGNAVQLDITQELSSVVQTATALAQGPTTNKRAIKTNVLLEDGQILVLGGLINDTLSETEQKVPGLGDLPLVGNLFRYRQTAKEKRNLMIFIHPIILRDGVEGERRSDAKYSYIRRQQLNTRAGHDGLLPHEQVPLLKPPQQVRADGSFIDDIMPRGAPGAAAAAVNPAATPPRAGPPRTRPPNWADPDGDSVR